MNTFKYMGLEIAKHQQEGSDGFVSFANHVGNGKILIQKVHFLITANDGSSFVTEPNKEINQRLFKSEAICLFSKFEESGFIGKNTMICLRFFKRPIKSMPTITISRFNLNGDHDYLVESPVLFNTKTHHEQSPPPHQKKPHHQHQQKPTPHTPNPMMADVLSAALKKQEQPVEADKEAELVVEENIPANEEPINVPVDEQINGNV